MSSQIKAVGQSDRIIDDVGTTPASHDHLKSEPCDHSPMLKTAQSTSYRLAHRTPAVFRPLSAHLTRSVQIPDPHTSSFHTQGCSQKSKFQQKIETTNPVELTERYKMAGNGENKPPKHEMVLFEQLMSSKRSFGQFRTVLHTGLYSQVVAMEIPVGGEIGDEVHTVDQILLFTSGKGLATVAGKDQEVNAGDVVVVPAGTQHQFVTRGNQPLELVTIYSPAEHSVKTVHKNKEQGDKEEEDGIDEAPDWSQKPKGENEEAGLVKESGRYD